MLNLAGYIVFPTGVTTAVASSESKGWTALATNVTTSDAGDLHIDLTIRNETADWSAMKATAGKPAVLTTADGKTTKCETVFVSTGGHRLAPGFQIRGYIAGKKADPITQLIYVECKGVKAAAGAKLSIEYSYVTGQYNYYEKEAGKVDTKLQVDLDQVAKDLQYPIAAAVDGLIQPASAKITALNDVVLTLTKTTRTEKGLQFQWQTSNPGTYPSTIHIGNPPVVGSDGILYGFYQSPDIASVPQTPAGKTAEWTTEVAVPKDVKGYYIMLSVEAGKQRLFKNYAIDISDQ
jgi:hypothetical protein